MKLRFIKTSFYKRIRGKAPWGRHFATFLSVRDGVPLGLEFDHQGKNPPPFLLAQVRREARDNRRRVTRICVEAWGHLRGDAAGSGEVRSIRSALRKFSAPRDPLARHVVERELEVVGPEFVARIFGE